MSLNNWFKAKTKNKTLKSTLKRSVRKFKKKTGYSTIKINNREKTRITQWIKPKLKDIGKQTPEFKGILVSDYEFKDISVTDYKQKYIILFFFQNPWRQEFLKYIPRLWRSIRKNFPNNDEDIVFIGVSSASEYANLGIEEITRSKKIVNNFKIPLLSDTRKKICNNYGFLSSSGFSRSAIVFINKVGRIKLSMELSDCKQQFFVQRKLKERLRTQQLLPIDSIQGFLAGIDLKKRKLYLATSYLVDLSTLEWDYINKAFSKRRPIKTLHNFKKLTDSRPSIIEKNREENKLFEIYRPDLSKLTLACIRARELTLEYYVKNNPTMLFQIFY